MPKISVIIPTAGRPALLERAIESCFYHERREDIEVIVIPNGPDDSWRGAQSKFVTDQRVSFHYQTLGDQSNARNVGIELASGELIRFLDDDDYLFPEVAFRQHCLMESEQLDFCSCNVMCTDQDNSALGELTLPKTTSSIVAALSRDRLQLPFSHVYRRSSIGDLRWPVGLRQSEDIVWLVRYAAAMPRRWAKIDACVGAWYQHPGYRQSMNKQSGVVHEPTAEVLLEAHRTLSQQQQWTEELSAVTAEALMELVHRAFPFRPAHWTKIATEALKLYPDARGSAPIYKYPGLDRIDPRVLLWLLLPKRLATIGLASLIGMAKGHEYKRTL